MENIILKIKDFIVMVWNGLINLIAKVFPYDFAYMIAIAIVGIIIIAIFRAILNRK